MKRGTRNIFCFVGIKKSSIVFCTMLLLKNITPYNFTRILYKTKLQISAASSINFEVGLPAP
jgi:hypothetical protein